MVQLCMGIPWGAPDDIGTLMSMVNNLPAGWTFSAFSISRNQLPYVALAVLAGGNIRVGLEDNIWLGKGVLATNADLVERAVGDRRKHGSPGARPPGSAGEALAAQVEATHAATPAAHRALAAMISPIRVRSRESVNYCG